MNAHTRNILRRYTETSEGGRQRMLTRKEYPHQDMVITSANVKGRTAFLNAVAPLIREVGLETTIKLMVTLRSEDLPAVGLGVYDNKKAKLAWLDWLRGKWIDQVLKDLDSNQARVEALRLQIGPILLQFTTNFLELIVSGASKEELISWMRTQGIGEDAIKSVEEIV